MADPNNPLTPRINDIEKVSDVKNKVINGAMDFWQRGISSSNPTTGQYNSVDRFLPYSEAGSIGNVQQSTDVPISYFKYSLQYNYTNTQFNGDSVAHRLLHRIESNMVGDLGGKTAIFSFYYKTNEMDKIQYRIATPNAPNDYSSQTQSALVEDTLVADGNWNRKTIQFTVPANAATDGFGIYCFFGDSDEGSLGTTSDFKITGVMLYDAEFGEDIPFQRAGRNYAEELQLCQRYYEKSYNLDISPGSAVFGGTVWGYISSQTSTSVICSLRFITNKRSYPVVRVYSREGNIDTVSRFSDAAQLQVNEVIHQNDKSPFAYLVLNSGQTLGIDVRFHWVADAEI